jgi:hypothetical protein
MVFKFTPALHQKWAGAAASRLISGHSTFAAAVERLG